MRDPLINPNSPDPAYWPDAEDPCYAVGEACPPDCPQCARIDQEDE